MAVIFLRHSLQLDMGFFDQVNTSYGIRIWRCGHHSTVDARQRYNKDIGQCKLIFGCIQIRSFLAGRSLEDDELEEMIESGNPAIFTQGVSNVDHNTIMLD